MALTQKQKLAIGIGGGALVLFALSRTSTGKALTAKGAAAAKDIAKKGAQAVREAGAKVFGSTEKQIATLDPRLQPIARQFVQEADAAGVTVIITSGRRTMAEQKALYDQGRSEPGKIVTKAEPGDSAHNFGLAFDFALANAIGQPTWPNNDPRWEKAAAIGKRLGLEWGGDWKSFKDLPHLELPIWKQARKDYKAGKLQVAGIGRLGALEMVRV